MVAARTSRTPAQINTHEPLQSYPYRLNDVRVLFLLPNKNTFLNDFNTKITYSMMFSNDEFK